MFNPLLHEFVAREQRNDRLRQAEQSRLATVEAPRRPAHRLDLRASLGNMLIAFRCFFSGPACAD